MGLAAALAILALSATTEDIPADDTLAGGGASEVSSADVQRLVIAAAEGDVRVEARLDDGEPPKRTCVADPACITRMADRTGARIVLFGELGQREGLTFLALDAFDVRTGLFAGREVAQVAEGASLEEEVPSMVEAVLDRLLQGRELRGKLPLLVVGLVPPDQGRGASAALEVPWLLFGSGVVAGGGVVFLLGAAVLYIVALERDLQAIQAGWQLDAWQYVQERNTYALASVMTAMVGAGLFLLASMGGVYWVLGDE